MGARERWGAPALTQPISMARKQVVAYFKPTAVPPAKGWFVKSVFPEG